MEVDMEERVTMGEWFCATIEAIPDFLDLFDSLTKHTFCSQDTVKLMFIGVQPLYRIDLRQRLLHSKKCTAWVAISKNCMIHSHWFKDENEKP